MSLQGGVSPPSSEGRASPTPVPLGSGVGAGLDPHGLTGQGPAARPPPSRPGLRGTEAGLHQALRERRGSGHQLGSLQPGLREPESRVWGSRRLWGVSLLNWDCARHCFL